MERDIGPIACEKEKPGDYASRELIMIEGSKLDI